jgi:hypothetical protein
MQAPLITRSAIFSIAADRPNVPIAAKTAVSMHAMATRRKNTSIAVSDGSPAEPIGRTMPPARGSFGIFAIGVQAQRDLVQPARRSNAPPSLGVEVQQILARAQGFSRSVPLAVAFDVAGLDAAELGYMNSNRRKARTEKTGGTEPGGPWTRGEGRVGA